MGVGVRLSIAGTGFVAGLIVGATLVAVGRKSASVAAPPAATVEQYAAGGRSADSAEESAQARTQAKELIEKKDYQGAYDLVLAASRLDPTDPALFDLVLLFVERASTSDDEEGQFLAEELLARAESLIPYQPITHVTGARNRLQQLLPVQSSTSPSASIAIADGRQSIEKLLTIAQLNTVPTKVRMQALEQAQVEIDGLVLEDALNGQGQEGGEQATAQVQSLMNRVAAVEQELLRVAFEKPKKQAQKWIKDGGAAIAAAEKADWKTLPAEQEKLIALSEQGIRLLEEMSPFRHAQMPEATACIQSVQDHVAQLGQARAWLYNKQVLSVIRYAEQEKEWSASEKLAYLAPIREEELSHYILQRHNSAWDKWFEELNEEQKVQAVRMRILRSKE